MWAVAAALLFLQASDPVAEGTKALEEGKYEAAAEAFSKAVAADPKDYYSHFNLALAYTFLHRDAEGVAEYRKTLELKPELYEAQLNAGILLMREKKAAEALPLLDAAAGQKPKEFRPLYYLADAQLQTDQPAGAEENFRRALEADPKEPAAHLGLARALARQGKLSEAAPQFREAAALDPNGRDALLELAENYEKNKQPAEAMALYRQFPGNIGAEERLGALLLETKQYAEAASHLEQAYAKDPTDANRAALAQAYMLSGDAAKAVPLWEKAVASAPADYSLRMAYGRALRDLRQFPAAAAQFQQATRLKADDPRAWSELGAALYMGGDLQDALGAFDRARELGENTPGNWFLRAIILDKLRQLKPALEAYQRFLSLSQGGNPDQEFQARQRARIIQKELEKR